MDENHIKLLFPADYPIAYRTALIKQMVEKIGDAVFAVDGLDSATHDLVTVIAALLLANQQTLAVIETASQGLIAAKCIGQSWLLESTYNRSFTQTNKTEAELIDTAKQLGIALRQSSGADFALVQLYSGTQKAVPDSEQAIMLYSFLFTEHGFCQQFKTLAGSPKRKQNQAALTALDLLRRFLQQKELLCLYYA
jgi:hypothetical protein